MHVLEQDVKMDAKWVQPGKLRQCGYVQMVLSPPVCSHPTVPELRQRTTTWPLRLHYSGGSSSAVPAATLANPAQRWWRWLSAAAAAHPTILAAKSSGIAVASGAQLKAFLHSASGTVSNLEIYQHEAKLHCTIR